MSIGVRQLDTGRTSTACRAGGPRQTLRERGRTRARSVAWDAPANGMWGQEQGMNKDGPSGLSRHTEATARGCGGQWKRVRGAPLYLRFVDFFVSAIMSWVAAARVGPPRGSC